MSRSVCGSKYGHTASPRFLPRHKWNQSELQDVQWTPQVNPDIIKLCNVFYCWYAVMLPQKASCQHYVLHVCVFLHCRPSSLKNCSTVACALHWRAGPWTQCTATCGRHGFQSRQVTCLHRRTGRTAREHHCMWRPRPPSWQRCNILSCGRGEKRFFGICCTIYCLVYQRQYKSVWWGCYTKLLPFTFFKHCPKLPSKTVTSIGIKRKSN